jgi:hypothetical protein
MDNVKIVGRKNPYPCNTLLRTCRDHHATDTCLLRGWKNIFWLDENAAK